MGMDLKNKLPVIEEIMKKRKIILLIIIILVVFLLVLYLYFENIFLGVSNYDIVSDKIPKEFNNFKIIQISDYHNSKTKKLNEDLIDTIKNEKPDMIVITGDFIDSRDTNIDVSIDLIKKYKRNCSNILCNRKSRGKNNSKL